MGLSRRTALKYGLGGAVALAVGAAWPAAAAPVAPLEHLEPRELAVLRAVAERLIPGGAGAPPASALGVAEGVDRALGQLKAPDIDDVRAALRLLDSPLALLLVGARPRAFTRAGADQQDQILARWRGGSGLQRTIFKVLHGLCMSVYWSDPRIYPSVGYPGPPDFGSYAPRVPGAPDVGWTPEGAP